jgi:hypothetical protein
MRQSSSDLFQLRREEVIEGDMVTRTKTVYYLIKEFHTLREMVTYANVLSMINPNLYLVPYFPKQYINRMNKLAKIKRERTNKEMYAAYGDPTSPDYIPF